MLASRYQVGGGQRLSRRQSQRLSRRRRQRLSRRRWLALAGAGWRWLAPGFPGFGRIPRVWPDFAKSFIFQDFRVLPGFSGVGRISPDSQGLAGLAGFPGSAGRIPGPSWAPARRQPAPFGRLRGAIWAPIRSSERGLAADENRQFLVKKRARKVKNRLIFEADPEVAGSHFLRENPEI